jgi:hypothetical protein
MTPRTLLLLTPGFGVNLLPNTQLIGGGAAPTSYNQPLATGTSAPAGLASNGDTIYAQTATAQRPLIGTVASITLAAHTVYTLSMTVAAVSGSLIAEAVIRFANPPAGSTVSYPVCQGNPTGGFAGVVVPGRLSIQIAVAATSAATPLYFGAGCSGNATGSVSFHSPMLTVGPITRRYRRGT